MPVTRAPTSHTVRGPPLSSRPPPPPAAEASKFPAPALWVGAASSVAGLELGLHLSISAIVGASKTIEGMLLALTVGPIVGASAAVVSGVVAGVVGARVGARLFGPRPR